MRTTHKIRVGLAAALLVIGLGAAGTGVAFAATPSAPSPPATAQATPGPGNDSGQPPSSDAQLTQMDQMMNQMVANLPADQRAAATRMHEQMPPAMAKMMIGDMSDMNQMGTTGRNPMTAG